MIKARCASYQHATSREWPSQGRRQMSEEISRKDPQLLKNLAILNWETDEIIPATDLIKWAIWFEGTDNHVGYDEVSGFIVSTGNSSV
jgi:hypothetical protein